MGSTLHTDSSPAGVVRPSLQSACKCCDKALNEAHTALTALSADSLLSLQLWAGGGLSYYKESLSLVGLPMIVIKVINIDLLTGQRQIQNWKCSPSLCSPPAPVVILKNVSTFMKYTESSLERSGLTWQNITTSYLHFELTASKQCCFVTHT